MYLNSGRFPYQVPSDFNAFSNNSPDSKYDNSILYADRNISLLIKSLERTGALKNTWLWYTSTHGESFNHEYFGSPKKNFFTAENTQIPYFIYVPHLVKKSLGYRIIHARNNTKKIVSNEDIYNSILSLYKIPEDSERSLFANRSSTRKINQFNPRNTYQNIRYLSVLGEESKLILSLQKNKVLRISNFWRPTERYITRGAIRTVKNSLNHDSTAHLFKNLNFETYTREIKKEYNKKTKF